MTRWQVSWLADRRFRPPSRETEYFPVASMAGALRLQLRGQPRNCVREHTHRIPLLNKPPGTTVARVFWRGQQHATPGANSCVFCTSVTDSLHRPFPFHNARVISPGLTRPTRGRTAADIGT